MTIGLPFLTFEKHLQLGINRTGHQNWPIFTAGPSIISPRLIPNGTDADDLYQNGTLGSIETSETSEQQPSFEVSGTSHTASDIWTPNCSVLTALKSVVPRSIADGDIPGSSVMSPSTQIFTSSLHRQTLFSVANNFAGLDSLQIKDIFQFLQKETNEDLYQLLRSVRSYSSRAIVQNIFKAAIEAGDARIADVLICENPKDIKVNEQFCCVKGLRYTPIERASMLRHEAVLEVLLKHGADVNRRHPENDGKSRGGALDYAVIFTDDAGRFSKIDPHPRIFRRLLRAGGDLSHDVTSSLVRFGKGNFVGLLMSVNGGKNAAKWSEEGIFRDGMLFQDDQTSMEIVKVMLECGVDLNSHIEHNWVYTDPCTVIDVAAQRGNLRLVNLLLESGALLTGDTLPRAIASGNQDLILLLLTRGADVNSIGFLRVTPLAAAIRLEDAHILKLIEDRGASAIMQGQEHLEAALVAASEVGNIQYFERLIQLGGKVSPYGLGYALMIATRDGWDEIAKTLIDAGADVNISSREESSSSSGDGPPLYEALQRRNEALILSLLDADANPRYGYGRTPPIVLAAEWGNRSVIENLIFAGAEVNAFEAEVDDTALTLAAERQDWKMLQLLLALGADSNVHGLYGRTALHVAAENGDIEMVAFLLGQGADPKDSSALSAALDDGELFDLLFERCYARYSTNWGESGARILAEAVGEGNERVIRVMLERRVNANVMIVPIWNNRSATPFGHAIARQQGISAECLELFLQTGCSPNDVVSEEDLGPFPRLRITALLAAIDTRNTSTIELLIRYGAEVNFPTRGLVKRTPLQRAAEIGNLDIVELLVNHGANVHAPAAERGGGTALQLAAIGGYIPIACRLLSLKADVNAPRSKVNGRTALEGAAEHGRLDMVKLLLNGGAGSEHGGEGQIANAIVLARDNTHYPIGDLLESHLSSRRQGSGLVVLADDNNREFTGMDLDDDPFLL